MWTALIIGSIVAACIGAAGGLGVAYLNKKSQEETNAANQEINQQNNAFNAEEAEKTRDFNAEQSAETRVFNAEEAEKARAFNAAEAEKQRQFEATQSSTAIQRRATDLKSAGFNPLLALGSPASTGAGAVASSGAASANAVYGGQASAGGFLPMKAADYSPLAQVSANLGHMVTSAAYIKRIQHLTHNDPQTAFILSKMARTLNSNMSGAGKVDTLSSISPSDIQMSKFLRNTNLWR